MTYPRARLARALSSAALFILSACGGDGGTPSTPSPGPAPAATTLSGTAAIGAPIAGRVVAIDKSGKISPPATTSALGAFTVDVSGMSAPFILSITGTAGGKQVVLNSVATAAGQTVNITPLTDLIVSTAAGQPAGSALANLCAPVNQAVSADCLAVLATVATPAKLDPAIAAVSQMIAPLNTAGTHPLTGAFQADGTGMDGVLDQILMTPALSGGDMATVTLIATRTELGQVTLPAAPGGTAVVTVSAPPPSDLDKASAATTVLPEIRTCLAAFSALYPATGFTAPTAPQVEPFVDASFSLGNGIGKAEFVGALTDPQQAAHPGFTVNAGGLSPYDMSPLTATEISTLSSTMNAVGIIKARASTAIGFNANNLPTSAWVQLRVSDDAGLPNWQMVKGAAYPGCPGGWKLAGPGHVDMHMNARIQRTLGGPVGPTFTRQWAFHIEKSDVVAQGADTVVVRGPGLSAYSGDPAAPVGAPQRLVLTQPTNLETWMWVGNGSTFYGHAESLQSCQDLATAATNPVAGTPCIDETKVTPGKLYSWELKAGGANGTVISAFPFQVNAVPLSKAFAGANQASLFATVTNVTPAGLAALNSLIAGVAPGTVLDDVFTFTYTQQAAYGSRMDNCGMQLADAAGNLILVAEQNAVGDETACTFNTAGLNAGDLTRPASTAANAYVSVTTIVLGNQASSGQPY